MSWCFSGNSWNFFSTRLQHSSPPPFTFVFVWPKSFPLCPRVSMGLSVEWTRKPLPGGRSLARRVPRRPRHVRGHQPRNASRRPRPSHCWIPLRPLWIHPVNLSSFQHFEFSPNPHSLFFCLEHENADIAVQANGFYRISNSLRSRTRLSNIA